MIYLLDKLERLVHIVPETALSDFVYQVELNVFDVASFELPADYALETWSQVAYFGFFYRESFLVFRIVENSLDDRRFVKGRDRAESDLRTVSIIKDKRPHEVTADQAVRVALEGSGYAVGKAEGLTQLLSTNFYYISPLEALVKVVDKWGCEFRTRYTFVDNRVVGRYIDLYKRQGKPSGRQFVYGDDLLSVVYEENSDDVVTALIGRGKGEELDSGGYGRRIEFSSVSWSKSKGHPITKPVGQNYITNEQARENLGLSQDGVMKHRWGVFVDDQIEDPEKLLRRTYEELVRLSVPVTVFKANILALGGRVWLGDTVAIIRDELKLVFEARIQKLVIDMLDFEQSEVVLGDYQTVKNSHRQAENRRQQARIDEGLSAFGQAFQQQLEMIEAEKERKNREIDEAIRKTQLDFDHYIIQAEQKAQETAASISAQIDAEIKPLANQAKTLAEEAKRDLQTKAKELGAVRQEMSQLETQVTDQLAGLSESQSQLDKSFQQALTKAQSAIDEAEKNKQKLISQANSQKALMERVVTVENTTNSTKATMTELTKSLDRATGELATASQKTATIEQGLNGLVAKFENIRVGGTNLVRGSREMRLGSGSWASGTFRKSGDGRVETVTVMDSPVAGLSKAMRLTSSKETGQIGIAQDSFRAQAGDYTISWWVRGRVGQRIKIQTWWAGNEYGVSPVMTLDKDGWQRVTFTAHKRDSGNASIAYIYLVNGAVGDSIEVMAPKLERGTLATDWSDYNEDYGKHLADYKQTVDEQLASLRQTTQGLDGTLNQLEASQRLTAQGFESRISELVSYKDGESERATQYLEASRTETAEQLRAMRTEVTEGYVAKSSYDEDVRSIRQRFEELTVSDNLLRNSSLTQNLDQWRVNGASIVEGAAKIVGEFGKTKYIVQSITDIAKIDPDYQIYTVSFDLKVSDIVKGNTNPYLTLYVDGHKLDGSWFGANYIDKQNFEAYNNQGWVRWTARFSLKAKANEIRRVDLFVYARDFEGEISFKKIRMDRSTIKREWSPHPEDLEAQTEQKLASFKTTIDGRFDEVTRQLGDRLTKSDFRQEADKIKQSVSSLEKDVVRVSDITINDQGIKLSASKTIGADALSSILTTSPESIQAITDKMVITSSQTNLVFESYRQEVRSTARDTWVTTYFTSPIKEGDEFLATCEAIRWATGSNPSFRGLIEVVYADDSKTWCHGDFKSVGESSVAKQATIKVKGLTKPVKKYRLGLHQAAWGNFSTWVVSDLVICQKQSAQLIVDGSISGRHLMAESIEGGHIKAGTITGDLLKVGAVTADKLLVDAALIKKLTADDALVNKLIAKEAFVNALSAVTFDFTKASGDYIQSKNGAMKWDLVANKLTFDKSARIEFKDFGNAVVLEGKGKLNGQKTNGGLAFTRVAGTDNVAVVVGTSSGNTFSPNDVTFTGLRALQDGYECGLYGSIIDICDTFDSSGHANWTNSIYINKNKGTITLTSRSFVGLNVGSSCSLTISPQGIVAKKGNYTRTLFS